MDLISRQETLYELAQLRHQHSTVGMLGECLKVVEKIPSGYEGNWIPCSDRMPEKGKAVLCSCRADIIDVMTFDYEWHDLSGHEFMKSFVIAWMQLPEPYKPNEDTVNELCRSNYAAQLESLGYNPDGNPKNGGKQ